MRVISVRLNATNEQQMRGVYAFLGVHGTDDSERFRDFLERASKSVLLNSVSAKLSDPAEIAKIESEIEQCGFRAVKTAVIPKVQNS